MEDVREPVSPTGQMLYSNILSLCILVVLEFEVPIHHLPILSLVKDAFLLIPRFTSVMVVDPKGVKRWKQVEVKFEEHIIEPRFCDDMPLDSYDKHFGDYLSSISMEKLPQNKPLWQAHVIKYPTSNAAGTLVFKFHHAIGDGYTLMGLLLSTIQRADDPSIPLSFPSRNPSKPQNTNNLFFLKRVPKLLSMVFNSMSEFGWSTMKSTLIEDDRTPIRSGVQGVEFRPTTISHVTFPIDHIKEIKNKLGVTINDVISGIIFYGIRLYMQDIDNKSRKLSSTALVMVNSRNVQDYRTVQNMLNSNAKGAWGNHISYLHLSMPKLQDTPISNPLQFVNRAHSSIKRKRNSFATILTEKLLLMEHKLKGPEAVAKTVHRTLRNSSFLISNMVGPTGKMALANHPIKDFFFTLCGMPQSLIVTIMSYMGKLTVTIATEEGFIDEKKLVWNLNKAFEIIRHEAAMEINIPTKYKL